MHERKLEGGLYIRIEHGLSKAEAQKKARDEKKKRKATSVRVIPEGGKYSVFRRYRKV